MSLEPIQTPDIERPPKALIDALSHIGSATASGELFKLGIRNAQMLGPLPRTPGKSICGPALTLQFMPKREDLHSSGEYQGPERQLHRHVLYHTQPGDVVVVDARGDLSSGVFWRDDADLFLRSGRSRCNCRWLYSRFSTCAGIGSRLMA